MLLFVAELLIGIPIEIFVLLLVFRWVEKGVLEVWQAVGIGLVPLVIGLLIARRHFRMAAAVSRKLIVNVKKLENTFESSIINYEKAYTVHTTLYAQFENAQEVRELITDGQATLLRKRWWWRPKRLSQSFFATVQTRPNGYEDVLPPKKLDLAIQPRTISDDWRFMFAGSVPKGINITDDSLFVEIKLNTLGSSNVTLNASIRTMAKG